MKKFIIKILSLNLAIILLNIFLFTVCGFSFGAENIVIKALSFTTVIMSILIFFIGNYKLITAVPSGPEMTLIVEDEASNENYRETLNQYLRINPSLAKEIHAAIAQMDSIDRKQRKLTEVMERNRITLNNLVSTGQDTEKVIHNNIRYIVNRVTIWDEQEFHNPKKRHIYEDHLNQIHSVLDQNDEILSEFDLFLSEVSQIKQEVIPKDSNLQSTISILKQLYNTNLTQTGGNENGN